MTDEVNKWSVGEWLKSFGFEKYLKRFIENGYETRKLCSDLKAEDLDEMEITDLPHRSILFNQSEMLRTGSDRPSPTIQATNGYETLGPSGGNSNRTGLTSPTTSVDSGTQDGGSDTYSTVFDDISESSKSKTTPISRSGGHKQHRASTNTVLSNNVADVVKQPTVNSRRTQSVTKNHTLSSSSAGGVGGQLKTKLELKLTIKEMVRRDGHTLNEPPYSCKNGSPNVSELAELAERYSDELNIESLTVFDALEDVWRHKVNENSDFVIPKSAKLSSASPGSATSNGSFVFLDQGTGTYSEPFDSRQSSKSPHSNKPSHHVSAHSILASSKASSPPTNISNGVSEASDYLDPYDLIDGNKVVIIKTSPQMNKKKPNIAPKPSTLKGIGKSEALRHSKKNLHTPDSPSLSTHSSSSDDLDKSPKVKKNSWVAFRGAFSKTPEVPKRKMNNRLSGSAEELDEVQRYLKEAHRQSLPSGGGMSRSISTNPAILCQQTSLTESLKSSKKTFGGSQGALHQYSPKKSPPIVNEFHKANNGPPPSPSTKSRVKALTLSPEKETAGFELSTVLEVYVDGRTDPVLYKARTLSEACDSSPEQRKRKGGLITRLFKKKDKKKSKGRSSEGGNPDDESEEHSGNEDGRGLVASQSLPNIAGVLGVEAKVRSEYAEVYDLLKPRRNTQDTPPELPSRTKPQLHTISPSTSPQTSPPAHHKLMVKSDSTSSSEIIHSLPSSGDDVIEVRVPTPPDATYNEPWTHIPIARSPNSKFSPKSKRNGSAGSSSFGSPRNGSLTISSSPIGRKRLFDNSSSPQTLPRLTGPHQTTGIDIYHRRRSVTPDDVLSSTDSSSKHSPTQHTSSPGVDYCYIEPKSKCMSSGNILEAMQQYSQGKQGPSHKVSPTIPHSSRPKLVHTQSSPNTHEPEKVIQKLKRTGVSFTDSSFDEPDGAERKRSTISTTSARSLSSSSQDIVEIQMKKGRSLKRKSSKPHKKSALEEKIELLLEDEGIDLSEIPYSGTKGEYGIPTALVSRYAQENRVSEDELVKVMDAIRRAQLIRSRRGHVPFKKDWKKFSNVSTVTLEDFLTSIGLPLYYESLMEHGISSVPELKGASNEMINSLPLKEAHKKHLCAFIKKL